MVKMALAHNVDSVNRTQDVQISEDVTFDSMLLTSNTLQGLKKSGFCYPSPIQMLGIPLGKCGFDLFLEAKSGTGKTAVFTIIALEKLDIKKGLQTMILAPTREIASQICDVVKQIGSGYKGLNVEVVIGGLSVEDDMKKFKRKVHVLVGSPGRLRHLIQLSVIDVSAVRLLIIDEADKLMEKSFLADINYIFGVLPAQKQVIMSSATYPEDSKQLISNYIKKFQHICPENNCVLKGVIQKVTIVKSNSNIVRQTQYRFKELLKILSKKQFKQCLIFCNYQVRVTELHRMLTKEQWPVELLYSLQEQIDRLDALKTLQEYKCRILISTDLAARGIDASNVDLVINFEPPFEWQTYLHRIGRAGRFGSYGVAITILSEGKEVLKFRNLLKGIKNSIKIQDFWTDETFEFDSYDEKTDNDVCVVNRLSEITLKEETPNNDIYSIVWDILTSEKMQNSKDMKINIESFDDLLYSCENFKDQSIHSFSDLIKSFDCIQDETQDNTSYQTVKVNDLHIEELLSATCSETILAPTFTNGCSYEETAVFSNVNDNENNLKSDTDVHNENNTAYQTTKVDGLKTISNAAFTNILSYEKTAVISNINDKDSKLESNKNVLLNNENHYAHIVSNSNMNQEEKQYDYCNKSMLNLSLPDCFSSKKTSHKKLHRRYKTNSSVKLSNSKSVQSQQIPSRVRCRIQDINYTLKGNQSSSSDFSEEDNKEPSANISRKARDLKANRSSDKSKQAIKLTLTDEYEYNLWHNKFKGYMKNIETAFYLNEMSKY